MRRRLQNYLAAICAGLALLLPLATQAATSSSTAQKQADSYCSSAQYSNSGGGSDKPTPYDTCVKWYEQGATAKNSKAVSAAEEDCKNAETGTARTICPDAISEGASHVTKSSGPAPGAPSAATTTSPSGTGCATTAADCIDPNAVGIPQVTVGNGIKDVITILSFAAGVLSVAFLAIGGIRYSTSDGTAQNVSQAKQTITFAIIGLVLSILAPLIVDFVIARGPQ